MKAILVFVLLGGPRICFGQCGLAESRSAYCRILSAQYMEAAIRASFGQPAATDSDTFRVEILDQSRAAFPEGRLTFPSTSLIAAAPDGVSVLHGSLETGPALRYPVWARVRMSIQRRMPVARLDLAAGAVLRDDQWEARPSWVPFPGNNADNSAWDGNTLAGAKLKRPVKQDERIPSSWLEYPLDIRRGQLVDLHVQTGGTHLRLQATAQGNARRGEAVEVRLNNDRGPGLRAVTSGPGRALVDTKTHAETVESSLNNTEGKR